MEKQPRRSIQPLPTESFYHLFWPSKPSESLLLTQICRIDPHTMRVNIEAMVLETWSIPAENSEDTIVFLHVADDTGSVIVKIWQDVYESLAPGDIVRILAGTIFMFNGNLGIRCGKGAKLERIGTTALLFQEEPNISLYVWRNEEGEELQTTSKKAAINYRQSTKLKVETTQSWVGWGMSNIPPSKRMMVVEKRTKELDQRKAELMKQSLALAGPGAFPPPHMAPTPHFLPSLPKALPQQIPPPPASSHLSPLPSSLVPPLGSSLPSSLPSSFVQALPPKPPLLLSSAQAMLQLPQQGLVQPTLLQPPLPQQMLPSAALPSTQMQPGPIAPVGLQTALFAPPGLSPAQLVQPGTLAPGSLPSSSLQPGAYRSGALHPGALQPGGLQPSALQPGALQPGTLQPGALQPGPLSPSGLQSGPVGGISRISPSVLMLGKM